MMSEGRRIRSYIGKECSKEFLRQRFSLDIQRRNAACVLGTAPQLGYAGGYSCSNETSRTSRLEWLLIAVSLISWIAACFQLLKGAACPSRLLN